MTRPLCSPHESYDTCTQNKIHVKAIKETGVVGEWLPYNLDRVVWIKKEVVLLEPRLESEEELV